MNQSGHPPPRKIIDLSELEAEILNKKKPIPTKVTQTFTESEIIEFDDEILIDNEERVVFKTVKPVVKTSPSTSTVGTKAMSYAAMTVEELEAKIASASVGSAVAEHVVNKPASRVPVSELVSAGPPPGLKPTDHPDPTSSSAVRSSILQYHPISSVASSSNFSNTSTAPLPIDDPNRGFMNRFEKDLIMRIHTTQLTTDTPLMDDFYYQALTKKRASAPEGLAVGPLLYFPLPSAAEKQREFQRRERRRKQRENKEKEKEKDLQQQQQQHQDETTSSIVNASLINAADLVLGKVSNSSSRKPRQQLQVPDLPTVTGGTNNGLSEHTASLHDQVLRGIEAVYESILKIEDFYLQREEIERSRFEGGNHNKNMKSSSKTSTQVEAQAAESTTAASATTSEKQQEEEELNNLLIEGNGKISKELISSPSHHFFIHFLTIPKGRQIIPRALKYLNEEERVKFLTLLMKYFDFLEVVRPECPLTVVDSFISLILSPLVPFIGEADWSVVMESLKSLFGKRSFIWIALTKAGMVLLCILLSRLEILKAAIDEGSDAGVIATVEEAAVLTEKIFDALEGHLGEFFTTTSHMVSGKVVEDNREFYAWQFMALLAMNVDSDRKRTMIMELRDKILMVVEGGEERRIKNLNVFLNALGLDASQLQ